jgi:hypothetical protein
MTDSRSKNYFVKLVSSSASPNILNFENLEIINNHFTEPIVNTDITTDAIINGPLKNDAIVLFLLTSIGIIGNVLIIFGILLRRSIRKVVNMFLLHHCVINLVECLLFIPFIRGLLDKNSDLENCEIFGGIYVTMVTANVLNIAAMTACEAYRFEDFIQNLPNRNDPLRRTLKDKTLSDSAKKEEIEIIKRSQLKNKKQDRNSKDYDVEEDINRTSTASYACFLFGIAMIWLASFILHLGITLIGSDAKQFYNYAIRNCFFALGDKQTYILFIMWIMLTTVSLGLTIAYMKKIYIDVSNRKMITSSLFVNVPVMFYHFKNTTIKENDDYKTCMIYDNFKMKKARSCVNIKKDYSYPVTTTTNDDFSDYCHRNTTQNDNFNRFNSKRLSLNHYYNTNNKASNSNPSQNWLSTSELPIESGKFVIKDNPPLAFTSSIVNFNNFDNFNNKRNKIIDQNCTIRYNTFVDGYHDTNNVHLLRQQKRDNQQGSLERLPASKKMKLSKNTLQNNKTSMCFKNKQNDNKKKKQRIDMMKQILQRIKLQFLVIKLFILCWMPLFLLVTFDSNFKVSVSIYRFDIFFKFFSNQKGKYRR